VRATIVLQLGADEKFSINPELTGILFYLEGFAILCLIKSYIRLSEQTWLIQLASRIIFREQKRQLGFPLFAPTWAACNFRKLCNARDTKTMRVAC
jgi:hypothetical protein